MPETKKYVNVGNFAVKDAFDNKYKSSLPKVMKAATEKAVNASSKLTAKPPSDKNTEGFYVDGTLTSLTKTAKGSMCVVEGEIKMLLATWPKKSMFAFPSASAKIEAGTSDKIDDVVSDLAKALVEAGLDKAIPEL